MKVQSFGSQASLLDRSNVCRSSDVGVLPQSYASHPNGPLHADPAARGVYHSDDGQTHIKQGDQVYPVRYDKDNLTWRVVSPENPTKYAYPVEQDENGAWRTHGKVGMPGGWQGDPLTTINEVQFRIDRLQQRAHVLSDQLQQLTQQWTQAKSDVERTLQSRPGGMSLPERQALMSEFQSLHAQRMSVLYQLSSTNDQIRDLRQLLR